MGSSNSRWRLAQRRPPARSSNQSRSAAVPPRASCWRRHCNTSVPATGVQSLKAEACANAIQIHTAVRADIQAPKAGGPAQRGSTANEAPADQRSPLSQWPPSTVDACRLTPLTSTGPRQWKRADPQGESRQSHHPEAGHCCPDRTNGGHPPEPPIWHCIRLAQRAEINAPLRCGHSTTTSAWAKATNQRFRAAKCPGRTRQRWLRVRFRAIGAPADPSPPAAAPARA